MFHQLAFSFLHYGIPEVKQLLFGTQDLSGILKSPVWEIFLREGVMDLLENGSSIARLSRLAERFPRVSCLLCLDH